MNLFLINLMVVFFMALKLNFNFKLLELLLEQVLYQLLSFFKVKDITINLIANYYSYLFKILNLFEQIQTLLNTIIID
jgi:hypothetical protein